MKPVVIRIGALRPSGARGVRVLRLRVPQAVGELKTKHESIRRLQKENADLEKELKEKQDRVRKLRDSRSEQELEIRRQLRYQREGETSIILPEQKPAK